MLFPSSLRTRCDVQRVLPSRVVVLSLTLSLITVTFSAIPAGGTPSTNLVAPPSCGPVFLLEIGVSSFAVPFIVTSNVRSPTSRTITVISFAVFGYGVNFDFAGSSFHVPTHGFSDATSTSVERSTNDNLRSLDMVSPPWWHKHIPIHP